MAATIVALATPVGEGGIGILRLSGSKALEIASPALHLHSLTTFSHAESRKLYYGHIIDPTDNSMVDEVLAVWMKAPTTYTGEDVVEIHCHSGMIPLRRTLEICIDAGAILANPGEFTLRAFQNGRLDLTQAEAVMDLVRAKSEASGKQAVMQLKGALGVHIGALSKRVLSLIASLEAWIDFSEEVDSPDVKGVETKLTELIASHRELLANANAGKALRTGLRTVIVGSPNVGKSSLLNALLGEERAIISEYPGTTRDTITEQIDINGVALILCDTAGMRESTDPLERLGVLRSLQAIDEGELFLLVLDGSRKLLREEKELLTSLVSHPLIIVANKSDLPAAIDEEELTALLPPLTPIVHTTLISSDSSKGVADLVAALERLICGLTAHRETALLTRERHVVAVREALLHLEQARASLLRGMTFDCLGLDLRLAWTCLAELTGEAVSQTIVDTIFAEFCIGK